MTVITHAVAGILVGKILYEVKPNGYSCMCIILSSVVFSLLPDLNIIWKSFKSHHKDFTHYPLFLIMISVFIFALEIIFTKSYIFALSFFINTLLHMVLDTFGFRNGMYLFFPFSEKEYSFTKIQSFSLRKGSIFDYIKLYVRNSNLFFESSFLIIAMIIIYLL